MSFTALALQKAIKARLDADTGVHALIGDKIYDRVPPNAVLPYVVFNACEVEDESADCEREAASVTQTLDIYSRDVGTGEAKNIAGAIRAALVAPFAASNTDGYTIGEISFVSASFQLPEDGITTAGSAVFQAHVEATS